MPNSNTPTSLALLDQMIVSHPRKLSERTMLTYRHMWNGYLKFLSQSAIEWPEASSTTIEAYLGSLQPLRKNHRAPSTVTQHRYWRILRDIYNYAVIYEWVEKNPVLDAQHPKNELMPSLTMPEWSTTALSKHLARECEQSAQIWQTQRDRAMLALMLCAAPKTGEVIALHDDDVLPSKQGDGLAVRLSGPRKGQERVIELSAFCSEQLRLWLLARQGLECLPRALFFGQKRIPKTNLRRKLTHKSVYILVTTFLQRALPPGSFEYGLTHQGAELIRNSVLAGWLTDPLKAHGDLEEIMTLAGVKDRRTIERLIR